MYKRERQTDAHTDRHTDGHRMTAKAVLDAIIMRQNRGGGRVQKLVVPIPLPFPLPPLPLEVGPLPFP